MAEQIDREEVGDRVNALIDKGLASMPEEEREKAEEEGAAPPRF